MSERSSKTIPSLLTAIITIVLGVTAFGFTTIEKKVSIDVFNEYKMAELRRDIRIEKDIDEINKKLDRLIQLRISEMK